MTKNNSDCSIGVIYTHAWCHQYTDVQPRKENINASTRKGQHLKTGELYSTAGVEGSIKRKAFNVTQ